LSVQPELDPNEFELKEQQHFSPPKTSSTWSVLDNIVDR
jgi:hypothetical protein